MEKTILIRASGEIENVEPKNGKFFTLKELQEFVGGYIEMVGTKDDRCLVANEEGLRLRLSFNSLATNLYIHGEHQKIVGDVLVCSKELIY